MQSTVAGTSVVSALLPRRVAPADPGVVRPQLWETFGCAEALEWRGAGR